MCVGGGGQHLSCGGGRCSFLYRGRSGVTAIHTPRGDDVAIVFRTGFVLLSD